MSESIGGLCKDCKHWDTEPLLAGLGAWGFCRIASHAAMPKRSDLDGGYAVNTECEGSEFMTAGYFGCVQFSKRAGTG